MARDACNGFSRITRGFSSKSDRFVCSHIHLVESALSSKEDFLRKIAIHTS